ncbi:MAG: hypothetical protein HZC41_12055 [Chloroflexi bacterium]|nr:hypothetical protein [Chloroflexota bacterium]
MTTQARTRTNPAVTLFFKVLLVLLLSLLAAFIAGEAFVRLRGWTDADGQFHYGKRLLKPYRLPVATTRQLINDYLGSHSYLMYDSQLGWTNRPNGVSDNDLYHANSAGLRADVEYELCPPPGILRIALFGDSFTHGDDVPLTESWGYRLEKLLNARGIPAEVINFGVRGYGMGQAFLRWQQMGYRYQPDVVLFGFQPENMGRNLNLFRPFYFDTSDMPFLKPRFVLDGDQLRLVNRPTPGPAAVPDVIAHFTESPLVEYEYFFHPDDYADHWWLNSKLLALLAKLLETEAVNTTAFYDINGQPARLARAIIEAFRDDVEAHRARFAVIHLPNYTALARLAAGQPLAYADLLDDLKTHLGVIDPQAAFEPARLTGYFHENRAHYTAEANALVAERAANDLERWLASRPLDVSHRTCVPTG